jgi:hypothetical protein
MYTGKTGKPCCLCGREETDARLDLPPKAIPEMDKSGPIAWQDVVGEVSIHFCADDWEVVRDLVLETGMSPLPKCNAARADFDLREDFEALLNATRDEPDHTDMEREMLATGEGVLSDPDATDRERVEALVVRWVLEPDGAATAERGAGD